jgi:hypothetical protein
MVRLEERPWRAQVTVLLDTRSRAHLVAPRRPGIPVPAVSGDDAPPPDTLEWVVEAAASIGTALIRRGAVLRVVTDAGELTPAGGRSGLVAEELLDRLADLTPSRDSGLGAAVEHACRIAGEGPLICLLGAVGADDVVDLVRSRSGPVTDLAVLVDAGSWSEAGATRGRRALSAVSRAELGRQRDDAAELLRAAGWQVALAPAEASVADVWSQLGRPVATPVGPLRTPA